MIKVRDITSIIESVAPLSLQESYDNAGLILGNPEMEVRGALLCIDVTEEVISEALKFDLNLIISHHPLIFNGIKKINGYSHVENCIIKAIKNDIAIYAAHTNLDNIISGVNGKIADKLELINRKVLLPADDQLMKIVTFTPELHVQRVCDALFTAGAGRIGNYDKCSFQSNGIGTFMANENAKPFVGKLNEMHHESETKIEVIFPAYLKGNIEEALLKSHPYEVPAYDFIQIKNHLNSLGSGLIGELENECNVNDFLDQVKNVFNIGCIRHNATGLEKIRRVSICGGAGSFLINNAIKGKSDIFLTADVKYHDFLDSHKQIVLADLGHFESEQFTKDIFYEIIQKKMPTFAVRKSEINTNPIKYL
jgi:dinuclear metal center YbgI/SA1388 family protein